VKDPISAFTLSDAVLFVVFADTYAQNGYSSLISAAAKGHVETVRLLLNRNADVDGFDRVS
jgi:ankyrin repeat protein